MNKPEFTFMAEKKKSLKNQERQKQNPSISGSSFSDLQVYFPSLQCGSWWEQQTQFM